MKESFFTHDRKFYNSLFSMLAVVALQNVLAYLSTGDRTARSLLEG